MDEFRKEKEPINEMLEWLVGLTNSSQFPKLGIIHLVQTQKFFRKTNISCGREKC